MTIALILGMMSLAYASTAADVKKGNLLYNNKKYDEAIKVYDTALEKKPEDNVLSFNKGDALYRKATYNAAIESYNKAIASGSPRILPSADYNIGNAQYRIGVEQVKTDRNRTKESYESALEFYKRAIDLNPGDRDAKYNYEFVDQKLMALKMEEEKEKKKAEKKVKI